MNLNPDEYDMRKFWRFVIGLFVALIALVILDIVLLHFNFKLNPTPTAAAPTPTITVDQPGAPTQAVDTPKAELDVLTEFQKKAAAQTQSAPSVGTSTGTQTKQTITVDQEAKILEAFSHR